MNQYILTIDQGTTSSRCIIFAKDGTVISSAQYEFEQYYPNNGWVEHAPQDILDTVIKACRECLASSGLSIEQISCVGITNQRETTLVWDQKTCLWYTYDADDDLPCVDLAARRISQKNT